MMKGVSIVVIGTEVGKTVVSAMISEAFHIFGVISHTLARIYDTSQIRNPL